MYDTMIVRSSAARVLPRYDDFIAGSSCDQIRFEGDPHILLESRKRCMFCIYWGLRTRVVLAKSSFDMENADSQQPLTYRPQSSQTQRDQVFVENLVSLISVPNGLTGVPFYGLGVGVSTGTSMGGAVWIRVGPVSQVPPVPPTATLPC